MFDRYPPKSVIVGIDGSQAAIRAARWAVHEVAGTDIPLCLVHVTTADPSADPHEGRAAREAAEELLHDACSAVDDMGWPVKIEMDVVHGMPVPTLICASRSTPLLCVGDTGPARPADAWLGSTAKELALSSHCSVAIIRGQDTGASDGGYIVARVDETPDDLDVLDLAINEALQRHAPLRVVTAAQSRPDDISGHQRGCVALDLVLRRLSDDYPEVDIETISLEGSFFDYLAENAASIQLVMVSSARTGEVQELLGSPGALALSHSDSSLLIVGLQRPGR
jgi:nucleotide-binding universal stress UspA family protein